MKRKNSRKRKRGEEEERREKGPNDQFPSSLGKQLPDREREREGEGYLPFSFFRLNFFSISFPARLSPPPPAPQPPAPFPFSFFPYGNYFPSIYFEILPLFFSFSCLRIHQSGKNGEKKKKTNQSMIFKDGVGFSWGGGEGGRKAHPQRIRDRNCSRMGKSRVALFSG